MGGGAFVFRTLYKRGGGRPPSMKFLFISGLAILTAFLLLILVVFLAHQ